MICSCSGDLRSPPTSAKYPMFDAERLNNSRICTDLVAVADRRYKQMIVTLDSYRLYLQAEASGKGRFCLPKSTDGFIQNIFTFSRKKYK